MKPKVIMDLENYQIMDEMIKHRNRLMEKLRNCYSVEAYEVDGFGQPEIKLRVDKAKIEELVVELEELDIYPEDILKTEWI